MASGSAFIELQCEGLIGPTHHYAGLSHGNIASTANAGSPASPRDAALQGLAKMRHLHSLGVPVLVIPPQRRPNLEFLHGMGFTGAASEMLEQASLVDAGLPSVACSASSMWAANMATCSPAADTQDEALHLTPANLISTLHRHHEAAGSHAMLQRLFGKVPGVRIHAPLPPATPLADEGAANHMRLCEEYGKPGVEVFVYGRSDSSASLPQHFPARQTLRASKLIAAKHHLPASHVVFVQQHPEAIDAGVFHNDVIAMSNQNLLIYHAKAFVNEAAFLAELRQKLHPTPLLALRVEEDVLPVKDAVESYFFNSQIVSYYGGMALLAPAECNENAAAHHLLTRLLEDPANPVTRVDYLEVRESMKNGGGPACLRLRVVMREEDLPCLPAAYRFTWELEAHLQEVILAHYPRQLAANDLLDKDIMTGISKAFNALDDVFSRHGDFPNT